jgi:hypothetical protein
MRLADAGGTLRFWTALIITPGLYLVVGMLGGGLLAQLGFLGLWVSLLAVWSVLVCVEVRLDNEQATIRCRAPLRVAAVPVTEWTAVRYVAGYAVLTMGRTFVVESGTSAEFARFLAAAQASGANPVSVPDAGPKRLGKARSLKLLVDHAVDDA